MAKGSSSGKATDKLTDLLIVAILIGALLGLIMSQFNALTSDTTNFTAGQLVVIGVFGIIIVLGVLNMVLKASGLKK